MVLFWYSFLEMGEEMATKWQSLGNGLLDIYLDSIVAFRNQNLEKQRHLRKEVNRLNQNPLTDDTSNCILNRNQVVPCSVMDL